MTTIMLGLLAETFIHPGVGQSDATVDLPVAREGPTHYPYIPGSGVKGALKMARKDALDRATEKTADDIEPLFGKQDNAGRLLISDARLLLLPVRSLTGAYRWLTCPHLIERFWRDLRRAGLIGDEPTPNFQELEMKPDGGTPPVLAQGTGRLFLEERNFEIRGEPPAEVLDRIRRILPGDGPARRLASQLAILRDDDFTWFARYGLPIQARNSLKSKDEKSGAPNPKTSTALWYEESLPPDVVMYLLLSDRTQSGFAGGSAAKVIADQFAGHPYLQLGGHETIGQGWFLVRPVTEPGKA